MCYVHGPEGLQPIPARRIDTSYLKEILDQSDGSFARINLTNFGEPFCDPLLDERLAAIRQYKNKQAEIVLITNGTLLTEDNIGKFAGIANPIRFNISFDSADPSVYSDIRRNADYHGVIRNISNAKRNAAKYGLNVVTGVHAVLMRQNIAHFPDTVRLAAEMGCDFCGGQNVAGSPQIHQSLFWTPALANAVFAHAKSVAEESRIGYYCPPFFAITEEQIAIYRQTAITSCSRLENTILLDPSGNIIPCCHQHPVIGNIMDGTPIRSIWGNKEHQALRKIVASQPECEGGFFDETGEGKCGACSALENRKPYLFNSKPFGFDIPPEARDYSC
jgi:radical SAM protein with 4Fe4S-binding SPASM domain